MSSLTRELVFLILQFLEEEKFNETARVLEKESGFIFNMRYFEDAVANGDWDEVEKYLSGFTKVDDSRHSTKIFFGIRKQKYLEALDRKDFPKAVEILTKELKVFSTSNEDLFREMTFLLALNNFRENEQLSWYGDTKSARKVFSVELRKFIEGTPLFQDKLQFPSLKNSRLRTLIHQSLSWQHQLCRNPQSNPNIKTLFVDHTCGQSNGAQAPSIVTYPLIDSIPKVGGFPPLGAHDPAPTPIASSLGGWMANPPSIPHPAIFGGPIGPSPPNNADSEQVPKRPRAVRMPEEVNNLIPRTVVANLIQGSIIKGMDFHPVQQTLLLVGTNIGDVAIWDVSSRERLVLRNFKVWNIGACSSALQASLADENVLSVNRVSWSPDGMFFGVAYSMHIIHLFSYHGGDDIRNHLEIDAHVGNVSDLAFSQLSMQLCVITCGEDKTIKVWDAVSGSKQYTFSGHEAPIYSICPHHKENIPFIYSTAVDGKIKAWLYDNLGSRVDYDAPGHSCTTMAYSTDGTRLFSCGTSKAGESYIVEWNESEGAVKRKYVGLGKRSDGVVQFDTTKNRLLAAGDAFVIKFWDMDNENLLTATDAEGGLPATPCIRFNKEGTLLAVSTRENSVKVLANAYGARLICATARRALDPSRIVSKAPISCDASSTAGTNTGVAERNTRVTSIAAQNGDNTCSLQDVKHSISDELDKSKIWELCEISERAQLRTLKLPDNSLRIRIIRLIYTNSGDAILALAYNAIHKLWKWQRTETNTSGKATTAVAPQFWQPSSGILMTNDISDSKMEKAVPCFALSKNDSYVMSASGGKISLFSMMSFKRMTTFMRPPPAATSLAFHPHDNNVIAVGMEDSSIRIYNARFNEVKSKLNGHKKRVTGLAFSNDLNVLVSSGADAQLCVWSMNGWEKKASKFLQIPSSRPLKDVTQTQLQFNQDQKHLLVVHESHIAIYDASKLESVMQWVPQDSTVAITNAAFSCDGQSVYACFDDGSVNIFSASASTLKLRCHINRTAYLPSFLSTRVFPLVIAAHPSEANQFALGLTDGSVHVLEPLQSEGKWGDIPPKENAAGSSTSSDQPSS